MQKISFYGGLLEKAIMYGMIALVLTYIAKWTQDLIPVLKNLTFWLPSPVGRDPISNSQVNSLHYLRELPVINRVICFIVEGGLLAIVMSGLFHCMRLMHYFKNGEIFSLRTIALLGNVSKLALIWALYSPFNTIVQSMLAFHETIDQRSLSIAYASDDACIKLVFFGFLLVLTLMLQEGYYLKSEQDLTV